MKQIFYFFDVKKTHNKNRKTQNGIALGAIFLLIVVFLFIHNSRKTIHDLPEIEKSGRLTVVTDSGSIGFKVKDNKVSGFQYELVKAFADSLGLELVISKQNDLKSKMEGLQDGDYNIIASLIPVTTEFKNEATFSIPLFTTRQVLIQRIQSDSAQSKQITKHFQLANDTIYISENSPYKMRLQHLSNEIANPIEIIEVKNVSTEQLVHLVSVGKIKFTICDEQLAQKLKQIYPNIDISLPIGFVQQEAWAVHPKARKLLTELNEFLEDFIGSSAYWTIYRKYY
jgi:membrane-bound lytic murein transglycosylase MltF